jgi:hypothetical protein
VAALAAAVAAGSPAARHTAAIGSLAAARLHDLPVLFGDIQDRSPNITRFLVLAARGAAGGGAPSGDDKTALLFVVQERVGSLVDVLEVFRAHRINLTAVEKRPCTQQQVRPPPPPPPSPRAHRLFRPAPAPHHPHPPQVAHLVHVADFKRDGAPAEVAPAPRSPSPLSAPSLLLSPSLLVPALAGGRGGQTALISRPYVFFVEAEGHASTPTVGKAIEEAGSHCVALKVLGSFPRARRVL